MKSEIASTPMKVLPPWMIREGMNLTKEQRGESTNAEERKPSVTSAAPEVSDDKKSTTVKDDEKNLQVSIHDDETFYLLLLFHYIDFSISLFSG